MDPCVVIMNEMLESGWRAGGMACDAETNSRIDVAGETTENDGGAGWVRSNIATNAHVTIVGESLE